MFKYYHGTRTTIYHGLATQKHVTPVLPKSHHTLKMMVSGLFVEFEITFNHISDIILNTVIMRT